MLLYMIGSFLVVYFSPQFFTTPNFYAKSDEIEKARPKDYANCIILKKNSLILITHDNEQEVSYNHLEQVISSNLVWLKEREFNIIYTKDTDYKMIVKTLELMTTKQIVRYKMLKA